MNMKRYKVVGNVYNNEIYNPVLADGTEVSLEEVKEALRVETPYFVSHFWEWISSGKMKSVEHTPEVPKVDITK